MNNCSNQNCDCNYMNTEEYHQGVQKDVEIDVYYQLKQPVNFIKIDFTLPSSGLYPIKDYPEKPLSEPKDLIYPLTFKEPVTNRLNRYQILKLQCRDSSMVEQHIRNVKAAGSSPVPGSKI